MKALLVATLAVGVAGSGCRTLGIARDGDQAEVSSVELFFASETEGHLAVELAVGAAPPEGAPQVAAWELWLSGRRFAAGETAIALDPDGKVRFSAPLHFRATPLSDAPVELQVGVRGALFPNGPVRSRQFTFARALVVRVPRGPVPRTNGADADR